MKIKVLFVILLIGFGGSAVSQALDNPGHRQQTLFKVYRSRDANEIWYVINRNPDGSLNSQNPIRAFWMMNTENNKTEPLSWVQNQYAYGIKVLSLDKRSDIVRFHLAANDKRTFSLRKANGNSYKVYTSSKGKEMEVTSIFVQIDGGSYWMPTISYVKLIGIDAQTGIEISETIYP